jgi:hypothetical protein
LALHCRGTRYGSVSAQPIGLWGWIASEA